MTALATAPDVYRRTGIDQIAQPGKTEAARIKARFMQGEPETDLRQRRPAILLDAGADGLFDYHQHLPPCMRGKIFRCAGRMLPIHHIAARRERSRRPQPVETGKAAAGGDETRRRLPVTKSVHGDTLFTDAYSQPGSEIVYRTVNGKRAFAAGDRIVLLQNDRQLGVKNGMLGTVDAVEPDALHVRLDGGTGGQKTGRRITIRPKHYQSFDHGYATTIHKAQGATVDRSFVMASATMDRHLTYVAMTRHRLQATLYAGRDEFRDIRALTASLGRSGLKETTLDYTDAFAERRGLKQPGRKNIRQKRAMKQTSLQPTVEGQSPREGAQAERMAQGDLHHQHQPVDVPAPLIAAITRYDKSIEEIAHKKARPHLEESMERLRNVARFVYHDAFSACEAIRPHILDPGTDPAILARAIRERPDQFGALRGRSGILGDNRERREALHYAGSVATLVGNAAKSWQRHLERERSSETWRREKRDIIEVPALTPRSEEILKAFDQLSRDEKSKILKQMTNTTEGRQALQEVTVISDALAKRFGTANLRDEDLKKLRLRTDAHVSVERIRQVAGLVERTHRAELVEKQKLTLGLTQGLGMRM